MANVKRPQIVVMEPGTWCLGGWGPSDCNYTGGHSCIRENNHKGRCRCDCGATTSITPPKWED